MPCNRCCTGSRAHGGENRRAGGWSRRRRHGTPAASAIADECRGMRLAPRRQAIRHPPFRRAPPRKQHGRSGKPPCRWGWARPPPGGSIRCNRPRRGRPGNDTRGGHTVVAVQSYSLRVPGKSGWACAAGMPSGTNSTTLAVCAVAAQRGVGELSTACMRSRQHRPGAVCCRGGTRSGPARHRGERGSVVGRLSAPCRFSRRGWWRRSAVPGGDSPRPA